VSRSINPAPKRRSTYGDTIDVSREIRRLRRRRRCKSIDRKSLASVQAVLPIVSPDRRRSPHAGRHESLHTRPHQEGLELLEDCPADLRKVCSSASGHQGGISAESSAAHVWSGTDRLIRARERHSRTRGRVWIHLVRQRCRAGEIPARAPRWRARSSASSSSREVEQDVAAPRRLLPLGAPR